MILSNVSSRPVVRWTAATASALAAAGLANAWLARKAERERPPRGRFLRVRGQRLHVVDRGEGKPLVLLHGNGSSVEDFAVSGLIDRAAARYRVIAFDRPGFGHSPRGTGRFQSPEQQADLLAAALRKLGAQRAIIFGHSWGTLVALALAIRHPSAVAGLVLASGYYFPTPRPDALLFSPPAIPLIGDVLAYTVWPLISRLTWRLLMQQLFAPAAVSQRLSRCLKPLALRPTQVRAAAAESASMIPAANRLSDHYRDIRAPVTIIAGDGDRIVSPEQAHRLQGALRISSLELANGVGHMVHHSAPELVTAVIDRAMIHAT